MEKMTIYVVDDNTDYRKSTCWWLEGLGYSVKNFSRGKDFLNWMDKRKNIAQECVLMDVRMPHMTGLDVHDQLNDRGYKVPIIYMTGHADVPVAVEAMQKGAITYLEKPLDGRALEMALDIAFVVNQKNDLKVDSQDGIENDGLEIQQEKAAFKRRLSSLTPREMEVLEGVVAGKMNKVLASDLGISIKTIEIHRAQIKKKLQAKNSTEIIKMVLTERAIN